MKRKLVIVVSHPIQHFAPFYRALAKEPEIDLTVVFCSRIGVKPYFDKAMNTMISWKMDLLGGYHHIFLPEADKIIRTSPSSVNNPSVTAEMGRIKPDAVLIYGYNYITSLRALWWCRRRKVPAMMISDSELKTVRTGQMNRLKDLALPVILRQYNAFLTVGDCNEDYLMHYGVPREKLFRSPFTIDEDLYQKAYKERVMLRERVRGELGIAPDEVVALTVGKLSKRKRPSDVVDAARALKAKGLEVRFVLVGNGEELERLSAIVEREDLPVILAGFINVDVLPGYYAAADMIVHTSERDPHPLVTCEGTCIALPLILSDRVGAVGPTDSARPGENALVFPVGDVSALAERVAELVHAPNRLLAMSVRSREIFEELDMRRSVRGICDAMAYCTRERSRL
ncbi:MAG: glycosyltransferase family 4 protein [Pseudomonadota bacterium]